MVNKSFIYICWIGSFSVCINWRLVLQGLFKKNDNNLVQSVNFTFHYIDDVLSLNNSRFGDFVDRIYPVEFEIKDIIDTDRSASYLDLHLEIDSERRARTTKESITDSSSTCIWSIHLSVDTIFQSLWFLSGVHW